MPATAPAREKLLELFGIDRRSLACFRIGLGALLLWDLWGRAKTLGIHYTGEGVYPRELARKLVEPDSALFHLFLLSDTFAVQAFLFGVFALLAVLLVLGWRTRIVSVLVFLFLVSLVRRNHWACHTGDVWLETLCFWAMLLPLGAHFSLDRLRSARRAPDEPRVLDPSTVGALLQVAVFYVMAGYLKARYDVWTRGEAVWVFTHVIEYTRPLGAWLGRYPVVCSFLTYATLVLEGLAPFVLFFPFWTARIRIGLFLVFAAFHLTLQAAIHIGIFQMMCVVALTLFLPSAFWDGLARLAPALERRRTELASALRLRFGRELVLGPKVRSHLGTFALRARGAIVVLAFVVIVVSNIDSAVKDPYDRADKGPLPLPRTIEDYGRQFTLVQSWNMFTDIDQLFFGWFLVVGQQEDGTVVDVLERRPFGEIVVPDDYARSFPNHNTRRYWREMAQPGRDYLQKPLCDWLAREWEHDGRPRLTQLAIFHVGRVPSEHRKNDLVRRVCSWEGPHQPLKEAPPEVVQLWTERRARWTSFLERMPKTARAAE